MGILFTIIQYTVYTIKGLYIHIEHTLKGNKPLHGIEPSNNYYNKNVPHFITNAKIIIKSPHD